MYCERCKKNEANVHLTRIINGKKEELHLCEKCAKETGNINFASGKNFTFQNLLSGILNPEMLGNSKMIGTNDLNFDKRKCFKCGSSYREFTQKGLFGCAECFDVFSDKLEALMKRIHGSIYHSGKIPKKSEEKIRLEKNIQHLNRKMKEAVKKENFEKAAEIRDEIHVMKNNMEEDKNE